MTCLEKIENISISIGAKLYFLQLTFIDSDERCEDLYIVFYFDVNDNVSHIVMTEVDFFRKFKLDSLYMGELGYIGDIGKLPIDEFYLTLSDFNRGISHFAVDSFSNEGVLKVDVNDLNFPFNKKCLFSNYENISNSRTFEDSQRGVRMGQLLNVSDDQKNKYDKKIKEAKESFERKIVDKIEELSQRLFFEGNGVNIVSSLEDAIGYYKEIKETGFSDKIKFKVDSLARRIYFTNTQVDISLCVGDVIEYYKRILKLKKNKV